MLRGPAGRGTHTNRNKAFGPRPEASGCFSSPQTKPFYCGSWRKHLPLWNPCRGQMPGKQTLRPTGMSPNATQVCRAKFFPLADRCGLSALQGSPPGDICSPPPPTGASGHFSCSQGGLFAPPLLPEQKARAVQPSGQMSPTFPEEGPPLTFPQFCDLRRSHQRAGGWGAAAGWGAQSASQCEGRENVAPSPGESSPSGASGSPDP